MSKGYIDWINNIICNGLLCDEYTDKVVNAKSKRQIVDIVLDANGISYLQEMMSKGHALPYEVIRNEFKAYINGRYISRHKNEENGREYTGSVYFEQSDDINVNTTIVSLLNCKCNVILPECHITMLYCDENCEVNVICPENSRCKVYYWGNAIVKCDSKNVKIIKKGV